MPSIGPFEDYPVYRLDMVPYGAVEEYAYENRDYYGDYPDWDLVRDDYISNVRDSLAYLMLDIDDMNRRLVFHTLRVEEDPTSDSLIVWVAVKDGDFSFEDYMSGSVMEMAGALAGNAYHLYNGNDRRSDRRAVSMLIDEREEVLHWMDHALTKCGFYVESPPTVDSGRPFRGMNFSRRAMG